MPQYQLLEKSNNQINNSLPLQVYSVTGVVTEFQPTPCWPDVQTKETVKRTNPIGHSIHASSSAAQS
jgi:hypothetical protein